MTISLGKLVEEKIVMFSPPVYFAKTSHKLKLPTSDFY